MEPGELHAALPLAAFAALFLFFRNRHTSRFDCLSRAALAWALIAWSGSNLLGLGGWLNSGGLRCFWAVVALGLALLVHATKSWPSPRSLDPRRLLRLPRADWVWMLACGALLGLTALRAVLAPPTTVDVLTYHAPRQLMWLQQGSLAHFTTINDRMLMMPPLAEVLGLQFLGLTGTDRWANLPQWFAYLWGAAGCFAALDKLRLGRSAAWLAAWLFLTLPMACHEASNGKNDLLATALLLALLNEILRLRASASDLVPTSAWCGVATGLAVLTKSTALLFAPPLLLLGLAFIERRAAMRVCCVVATVSLLISGPFFARNLSWYGTPLGVHRAEDGGHQQNALFTPAALASNITRHATLHLSSPWPAWNQGLVVAATNVHRMLGLDYNDPRTTLWEQEYSIAYSPKVETLAGAPAHFLLIGAAIILALRKRVPRELRFIALAVLAMAFLYCLLLKWQPWAPRLQLGGFAVGSVLLAGIVATLPSPWRKGATVAVAVAAFAAWWPGAETSSRPLWSEPSLWRQDREAAMYRLIPALRTRDSRIVLCLQQAGVNEAALLARHSATYPLMRRLQKAVPDFRFATDLDSAPPAILVLDTDFSRPASRTLPNGTTYFLVPEITDAGVYLQADRFKPLVPAKP